jgi:hypothetical protein
VGALGDLLQVFETEVGEGHDLDAVDEVGPKLAVFTLEQIRVASLATVSG